VAPCKSTLRKKRNLTTDIQQQLTSTKKKAGKKFRKNKKYQSLKKISLASQTYCQHHGRD